MILLTFNIYRLIGSEPQFVKDTAYPNHGSVHLQNNHQDPPLNYHLNHHLLHPVFRVNHLSQSTRRQRLLYHFRINHLSLATHHQHLLYHLHHLLSHQFKLPTSKSLQKQNLTKNFVLRLAIAQHFKNAIVITKDNYGELIHLVSFVVIRMKSYAYNYSDVIHQLVKT